MLFLVKQKDRRPFRICIFDGSRPKGHNVALLETTDWNILCDRGLGEFYVADLVNVFSVSILWHLYFYVYTRLSDVRGVALKISRTHILI